MTDKATIYTIRSPQERAEIGKRLELVPIPREGLDVFVRKHEVKLTNPQRARLFWLHGLRAQALNAQWPERAAAIIASMSMAGCPLSHLECSVLLNKTWTKDDMHEQWKARYGVKSASSTRGPSKMSMVDRIEEYQSDLVELEGVDIPTEPEWEQAA